MFKLLFSRFFNTSRKVFKLKDNVHSDIADYLEQLSNKLDITRSNLVILCIGSVNLPADALGPFVGTRVSPILTELGITVIGTYDNPIDANNLNDILVNIPQDKYILVVDACLGNKPGSIIINEMPCYPGLASGKNFPPIGNLTLYGVVAKKVQLELSFLSLSTVSLSKVMQLADAIAPGIIKWSLRMKD